MISGIYTAVMLLIFIGVFLWAWSCRNKQTFEELAHLPLEKDPSNQVIGNDNSGDNDE